MIKKSFPIEFKRRILREFDRKVWSSYCNRIANFLLEYGLNIEEVELISTGSYEFDYKAREVPIAYLGCKGRPPWTRFVFIVKRKPRWHSLGMIRADVISDLMRERKITDFDEQETFKQSAKTDPVLKKEISKRVRAILRKQK